MKPHTLNIPRLVQCAQFLECVKRPIEFTLGVIFDENVPMAQNFLYGGGGERSVFTVVDEQKTRCPRSKLDLACRWKMVSRSAVHIVSFNEGVHTAENLVFVFGLGFPGIQHGSGSWRENHLRHSGVCRMRKELPVHWGFAKKC